MTGFDGSLAGGKPSDSTSVAWFQHSHGERVSTEAVMVEALRKQYPQFELTVSPSSSCNLLSFAAAGQATAEPIEDPDDPFSQPVKWRMYAPPAQRQREGAGFLYNQVKFAKYMYKYKKSEFIVYAIDGRDGAVFSPPMLNNYILGTDKHKVDELVIAASKWQIELHDEIWVFDMGFWRKNAELYRSIQSSKWSNVILPEEKKRAIIDDVDDFFDSEDVYKNLQVPWKRGVIYYGPPGNGKTISIKAMMHSLYKRKNAIPTLYVRSLKSFGGPEYSVQQIFIKARQEAPCYLVFEDLDSLVNDEVRSYFLNEVDGLKENDGIFMVGSTNHLEKLDDGIAKRPSRFDRKYEFPNPNLEERTEYAKFWQRKLSSNHDIEYPDEICPAVAKITDKFSFAYMQEAYVAALLAMAREKKRRERQSQSTMQLEDCLQQLSTGGESWKDTPLWRQLKKQIAILREGIEGDDASALRNEKSSVAFEPQDSHDMGPVPPPFPHQSDILNPTIANALAVLDSQTNSWWNQSDGGYPGSFTEFRD